MLRQKPVRCLKTEKEKRISKGKIQGSRCEANSSLEIGRKREKRFTCAVCVGFVEAKGISFWVLNHQND